MTKELIFEKNAAGDYAAKFTSTGPVAVQVMRKDPTRSVSVSANIPGMAPAVINIHNSAYGPGLIFSVDVPVGCEVTLCSPCEIAEAKMMSDD